MLPAAWWSVDCTEITSCGLAVMSIQETDERALDGSRGAKAE